MENLSSPLPISKLPIAFAEWCQKNKWYKYPEAGKWVCQDESCEMYLEQKTDKELFEYFLINYKS